MRERIYSNIVGLQREMLKLIGEVTSLTDNPLALEDAIDEVWHPKCDVFQTDTEWIVIAELAGVEKDDIAISVTPEYLRISGTRNFPPQTALCAITIWRLRQGVLTGGSSSRMSLWIKSIPRSAISMASCGLPL
jgi:hypothetical protein